MTFGENRERGGGFAVSFSTVANGVAVLALVALCSAVWGDHDSLTKITDRVDGIDANLKRIEGVATTTNLSAQQLGGEVLGLKGENGARRRESENLGDRVKNLEALERDLERMFNPPRVDRSGH